MDNLSKSFLGLSALGIAVSIFHGYDEITEYSSAITRACDINNFWSCTSVFNSGFTSFLGLDLWVYGVVWFPLMLALGYWFVKKSGSLRAEVMVPLLMVGNVFTLYLWYLELVKIHALCPVCISLYILNYLMTAICIAVALREH